MKSFFKTLLAVILGFFISAFLVTIIGIGIISVVANQSDKEESIDSNTVLHLTFNYQITDRAGMSPLDFSSLSNLNELNTTGLNTIVKNIRKAKNDSNIKGIYLELSDMSTGIASIEEIRNALIDFKTSNKFIIARADYYSQGTYYLASVADKIYLTPTGSFAFTGLSAQVMYYKNALDKLGVEPQIIRHGKFKSAVEPFMQDKMSDANKEQILSYMGTIWNHMVDQIAIARNIEASDLQGMADSLMVTDEITAMKYNFVDSLKYNDEVIADLKKRCSLKPEDKLQLITLKKYTHVPEVKIDSEFKLEKDKIAVIYAIGAIEMGEGDDFTIGANRLAKAIKSARENKNVKAIVLRINSPGGSALASEIILREAKLAQKEKPFIVSMGELAASGGYYIACASDTIVAQPNTLTGSIGVFGLMFNAEKLLNEKIGINIETINTNTHSDIGSQFRKMTDKEQMVLQNSVENIYTTFITHVANNRGLTIAQVDSIGQGRVWSGINAKQIGLVDVIGGLDVAIDIAAKKANVTKYRILELPEAKDPFTEIMEQLGQSTAVYFKSQFGINYKYFKQLEQLQQMQGVQARLLFAIDVK